MATITSREFNQDTSSAKRAAESGPVVITDGGRPARVLLTYAEYERLLGRGKSLLAVLADPGAADVEFEPERVCVQLKPVDF